MVSIHGHRDAHMGLVEKRPLSVVDYIYDLFFDASYIFCHRVGAIDDEHQVYRYCRFEQPVRVPDWHSSLFPLRIELNLIHPGLLVRWRDLNQRAIAFIFKDQVREYIQRKHDAFVQLLLSYPRTMTIESWRYCLRPQLQIENKGNKDDALQILAMCLFQVPRLSCRSMVFDALEIQNVPAVKLLNHTGSGDNLREISHSACQLACRIQDHCLREECLTILSRSGFLEDILVLREELMKATKARHLFLVRLLVDANVILDAKPNDATSLAASKMDFDVLLILRDGILSSPPSEILYSVPEGASELDVLRFIEILSPIGLEGEPISWRLTQAVAKEYSQLYGQAWPIRLALELSDDKILNMLISRPCSPKILSAAIPTAMALEPLTRWHAAMQVLLNKGLPSKELGSPYDIDYTLIESLIQHRALLDASSNGIESPVAIATKKGNLFLLQMLCQGGPSVDTVSTSVPMAFDLIHTLGLDVSLQALKLLLKHGGRGDPVHQTLVASVEEGSRQIVSLLLESGANANYADGFSYAAAFRPCPPDHASLQTMLPPVTCRKNYNSQALEILLVSSPDAAASKGLMDNPNLLEVNGILLRFAICEVDFEVLERLLCANPSLHSLESAFDDANSIENRNVQLEFAKLLLEHAGSFEIGQSRELFTETALTLDGDLAGLQLLLFHNAVVDYDDGKAVLAAAVAGVMDVLDLLLRAGPNESTIKEACLLKLVTFQRLLTANEGMSAEVASDLLFQSVEQSPESIELPRLLLARGAVVEYSVLETALETAHQHSVLRLFRGLSQSVMPKNHKIWAYQCLLRGDIPVNDISEALLASVDAVFDLISHADSSTPHVRVEAYRLLLSKGVVSKTSIQRALESNLAGETRDPSVVEMMLENGANPNKDGARSFFMAITAQAEREFEALSKHANINGLLQALISRFADELKIAHWFGICLRVKHVSLTLEELYQNDLLFECMRKFPKGNRLLGLLLGYRMIGPNAKTNHSICPSWESERCTALIWALSSTKLRIENDAILALFSIKDMDDVDLLYRTRNTQSCTPVLRVLLDLERGRILKSKMLGTNLANLSSSVGEITLHQAAVFVGNFDAYRAMDLDVTLAPPLFVQWFLLHSGDDPNRTDDEYDCLIPLALAVASPHQMPWFAMKETIATLATDTNLKWRHGGLTVLHYAIESGPWMIEALIQGLGIYHDPQRHDRFMYKDKDGMFYSPDEYVKRVLKVDEVRKSSLLSSRSMAILIHVSTVRCIKTKAIS
ncbi:hypothetical protein F5Y16DRAFT_408986 [Xylariaceae sp. FL0255]|nr:hypothetical protein F5Y16DRAFT_408986 [Xylariaceae sp. FL0255]